MLHIDSAKSKAHSSLSLSERSDGRVDFVLPTFLIFHKLEKYSLVLEDRLAGRQAAQSDPVLSTIQGL